MRGPQIDVSPWSRRLGVAGAAWGRALEQSLSSPQRFGPHEVLYRGDDRGDYAIVVLSGLAGRLKETVEGARQISAILTPGDVCSCGLALALPGDYALVGLSHGACARLRSDELQTLQREHPDLMLAIARTLVEEAVITREWVVNAGARTGRSRVAHLLSELVWRLAAVGRSGGAGVVVPLMQRDIAAAVGLSIVQVNRVLQQLGSAGLVDTRGRGGVRVLDRARLALAGEFDPHYLEVRDHAAESLAWRGIKLH
jgi:CRP-like cAMP-binding protein